MEKIWNCNGLDGLHRDGTDSDSAYGTSSSPRSLNSLSPSSPPPGFAKQPLLNAVCSIVCVVCRKIFSNPKVLPCFHMFCASCIQVTSKSVYCPQCRCEFVLPVNGVEAYNTHSAIVSFIDSLKGQNLDCTACRRSDRVPAIAKCVYCDNFLCHVCCSSFGYMRCSSGHRVIEIPKDSAAQLKLIDPIAISNELDEQPLPCTFHFDNPVSMFCGECNEAICTKCHEDLHKSHGSVMPITDAETDFFKFLKNSLTEKEARLSELALNINQMKLTEDWIKTQYQQIHSKINESYQEWAHALVKHRQTQLSTLDVCFSKLLTFLQNSSTISLNAFDKTQRVADFFWLMSKYSSAKKCIVLKKLIDSFDVRLMDFRPNPNCNLKFMAQTPDVPNLLHHTFGHVELEVNGNHQDKPRSSGQDLHRFSGMPLVKMPTVAPPSTLSNFPASNPNSGPHKYTRWSSSGLDDLKSSLADLDASFRQVSLSSPYLCIRSPLIREVISYSWRFGSYGSLQGQFTEPNGIAVNEEGEIIVADTNNNRVQVFDLTGRFKFSFGECLGMVNNCRLLFPNRVAVTHSRDIVVSERAPTHQIQLYSPYGQFIRKFGVNVLNHPRAIATDKDGNIIVVECKIMRVVIFNSYGDVLKKFSCSGVLHFPNGVVVNEKREIFISDNRTHSVVVFNYEGSMIRVIGQEGLTNYPIAVMLNKHGHVVIADNHNNFNLTIFTQEGELLSAYESKVKHAQCYDAAITLDGTVVLTSKDYRVYGYCLENHSPTSSL